MAKEEEKKFNLKDIVKDLNKTLKLNTQIAGDATTLDIPKLPTGSLTYDICMGGGFPIGRHTVIYGAESSGKTTISLMGLVEYFKTKDKRAALILDSEYAFDRKYAEGLGVDMSRVIIFQPDHLAEGHEVLMNLLRSDSIGYFVTDSIASLLPKSVIENAADASNIGRHAMGIGNMFKISNQYVGKNKVTAVWINQIRDSIGGYSGGISLPAGHAPKFYASVMLQVMRGTKVDNGDNTYMNRGKIRCTKNKVYIPYMEGEYDMEHGSGISLSQEVLDYGVQYGVLYKKGNSFYYDEAFENDEEKRKDHVFLGKSKGDAKQFLNDNVDLRATLADIIKQAAFQKE